jgi:subtilisin family serine protease
LDNVATWDHWTFVSWIIAAEQNNKEWISGIAKNVKIMPLRVFTSDDNASTESIISAINYAIDNWANIINLSLG